jgi:hypothetical protein
MYKIDFYYYFGALHLKLYEDIFSTKIPVLRTFEQKC